MNSKYMCVNISILGSVRFLEEPSVQNIKNVNLKQLSENTWMANQDTVLSGRNMNFDNITLEEEIVIVVRTLMRNERFTYLKTDNIN